MQFLLFSVGKSATFKIERRRCQIKIELLSVLTCIATGSNIKCMPFDMFTFSFLASPLRSFFSPSLPSQEFFWEILALEWLFRVSRYFLAFSLCMLLARLLVRSLDGGWLAECSILIFHRCIKNCCFRIHKQFVVFLVRSIATKFYILWAFSFLFLKIPWCWL